jgi:secreted trypsin-like serine protease
MDKINLLKSLVILTSLHIFSPAYAVTNGTEDKGPILRRSLMILSDRGSVCSAVVTGRKTLLTAGHCVSGAASYVAHYRDDLGKPVLVPVQKVTVHPGYNPGAIEKRERSIDLAVVHLKTPLPDRFEAATLRYTAPKAGENVMLSGWGTITPGDARSTGVLRTTKLTVIEPYGPSRILLWLEGQDNYKGSGACQGDSGGPLLQEGKVIAITAFAVGANGKGCGGLSQGVLLAPQKEWVEKALRE